MFFNLFNNFSPPSVPSAPLEHLLFAGYSPLMHLQISSLFPNNSLFLIFAPCFEMTLQFDLPDHE